MISLRLFQEDIDRLRLLKTNSLDGSQLFPGAHLSHVHEVSGFEVVSFQKTVMCKFGNLEQSEQFVDFHVPQSRFS